MNADFHGMALAFRLITVRQPELVQSQRIVGWVGHSHRAMCIRVSSTLTSERRGGNHEVSQTLPLVHIILMANPPQRSTQTVITCFKGWQLATRKGTSLPLLIQYQLRRNGPCITPLLHTARRIKLGIAQHDNHWKCRPVPKR